MLSGLEINPSLAHWAFDTSTKPDLVLICLKPQQVKGVLHEIRKALKHDAVLISVAASVTTALIERELGRAVRVVRAMPNTPCLIRQGMTALAAGRHATEGNVLMAREIFSSMGRIVVVGEEHMDAITGLSASGPAYVYMIIESLAEAGVKMGLPRDLSTELSAQTLLGASAMVLHTGEHPAKLKDIVTTPAGCTIDGLLELEEGGLRVTLIKAVVRAGSARGNWWKARIPFARLKHMHSSIGRMYLAFQWESLIYWHYYFFKKNMPKRWRYIAAYLWSDIGNSCAAAKWCLMKRSSEPMRGILKGYARIYRELFGSRIK